MAGGQARQWLRAATKPRLLGILVILLIGALVAVRLGVWQLDRAQIRGDQQAAMEQAEREAAPPQELGSVVPAQTQLTQDMVGVRVVAEGEYRAEDQFFVTGREHEGEPGYWVLTALELTEGEQAGAIVPVVRGWVAEPDPQAFDQVPAGPVEVLAYLAPSDGGGSRLPEPDMLDVVSSAQLVNEWGGPIYSAHLRLISQDPAGPAAFEDPGPPEIADAGLNLQNLAYAAEWWIFGGFAIFLWWRLVRDEVRYDRENAAGAGGRDDDGGTGGRDDDGGTGGRDDDGGPDGDDSPRENAPHPPAANDAAPVVAP